MTRNEILRRFPNAGPAFIRANVTEGPAPGPQPEQALRHRAHGEVSGAKEDCPRYAISIVAFRKRLIDPDNLSGKYFVDALRYAGVIVEDTASLVDYSIRQEEADPGQEDYTVINIRRL